MNARIEKKLSKRLVAIAPALFHGAWADHEEPSELAYKQGSSIAGCLHLGGGLDYWGEGTDAYTVWEYWSNNYMWIAPFPDHPEGHRHAGFPNIEGFNPTTRNLLKLAEQCNRRQALPMVIST